MSDTRSTQEPGYLTLDEAAAYLNVAIPTLRNWLRTKGVPYHRPGKRILFRRTDLDSFMQRHRHGLHGLALTRFTERVRR